MATVGTDREAALADLISAWQQRRADGNAVAPTELCRERPELLPELERRIAALEQISVLNDPLRTVDEPARQPNPPIPAQPRLQLIGRFDVKRILGQGGFGMVYLAHDNLLQRSVAIKVPHRHLVSLREDAEAYLTEARTVASLDHPNIVPVYEVVSDEQYPILIVSKYIEGTTLAQRIKEIRPSLNETVEVVATVAETLHYAHGKGLVHRDIKPGNILLDSSGKPFVADFGLALREEDVGKGPCFAGTPAYMSPEQAKGEGHRVDGRSDIFSLGIVFYELLTGRLPFHGDSAEELREQVMTREVRPPRQRVDTIPKELERICLKALSKRSSERYSTAKDMAEDLRHFLADASVEVRSVLAGRERQQREASPTLPMLTPTPSGQQVVKIVPKGLRSFDATDADFYLELLPGPRDRDGLPDSIRFWKRRIDTTDAEDTFAVGLIYGPSGCGKSSLVKAGLLPRLAPTVTVVYVEATGGETEARLLKGLRRQFAELPGELGLIESLAALRQGQFLRAGRKVLLVLDQFEQWLHARRSEENTELVQALRQCDGGRVQCLALVRDDFGMAAMRFMAALDIPLAQGNNFATVDLFDLLHARKVLGAFGRAYGRLPDNLARCSKDESTFLDRAVAELAQDGKVISVRLALFAEMIKGKPWNSATLKEVGGAAGVGVALLEETFSAPTANPQHRLHQKAAQAVLKALLPEARTDIRGHMRSHAELLAASGHANRSREFDDLLRILDDELRLITPTDPEGKEEGGRMKEASDHLSESSFTAQPSSLRYYQLTHDFLVPAVREWLTRKQRESCAGRAQLLLTERAALWTAKPETKQLPSFLEWLTILGRTSFTQWSEPQSKLMRIASRRHLSRLVLGLAVLVAVVLLLANLYGLLQKQREQEWADHLVDQLLVADVTRVAAVADQLDTLSGAWSSRLERIADDDSSPEVERLRAHLAVVRNHPESVPFLVERLLKAVPDELDAILQALRTQKAWCLEALWSVAADPKSAATRRLRAAVALAELDPVHEQWTSIAGPTAAALVRADLLMAPEWTKRLRPVRKQLLGPLVTEFNDRHSSPAQRTLATSILADYASDEPELLARLLLQADTAQFRTLFPAVKEQATRCVAIFEQVLAAHAKSAEGDLRVRTRSCANAAAALFLLDRPQALHRYLGCSDEPDVRTALIDLLPNLVELDQLWSIREKPANDVGRQAILLALDAYCSSGKLSAAERSRLETGLGEILVQDESAAVHSAAEWLLRRLGRADRAMALTEQLAGKQRSGWRVSSTGHVLAILHGPVAFEIGSLPQEHRRDPLEDRSPRRIPYTYEIGIHEVTAAQFLTFFPNHRIAADVSPTPDCPMNYVSWYDVARYCRRLSEAEGIPEKEMIFPPVDQIREDQELILPRDWLRRSGYRWPTEAEWEFASRGGTTTIRFFGAIDDAFPKYGWGITNADERCWPVGSLRPNPYGLFDVLGNISEWCFDRKRDYSETPAPDDEVERIIRPGSERVFRGGMYKSMLKDLRMAKRNVMKAASRYSYSGFRIARTVPSPAP